MVHDPSAGDQQDAQQLELGGREPDLAAGQAHAALAVVDGKFSVRERLGPGVGAQCRTDPAPRSSGLTM